MLFHFLQLFDSHRDTPQAVVPEMAGVIGQLKIVLANDVTFRQNYRALYDILQLPDISG